MWFIQTFCLCHCLTPSQSFQNRQTLGQFVTHCMLNIPWTIQCQLKYTDLVFWDLLVFKPYQKRKSIWKLTQKFWNKNWVLHFVQPQKKFSGDLFLTTLRTMSVCAVHCECQGITRFTFGGIYHYLFGSCCISWWSLTNFWNNTCFWDGGECF